MPGHRERAARRSRLVRIRGGEEEQDLGLERVGVLELVDEDVREAPLQLARATASCPHEVAGAEEQEVEEVELAGARLSASYDCARAGRSSSRRQRGEVGVGLRRATRSSSRLGTLRRGERRRRAGCPRASRRRRGHFHAQRRGRASRARPRARRGRARAPPRAARSSATKRRDLDELLARGTRLRRRRRAASRAEPR